MEEFRRGLRQLGYTEGPGLTIHYRFAEGNPSRLQGQVTDLVRLKVDVIVAVSAQAAVAAHKETQMIPIVMTNVGDPMRLGLVASLARPGGNVTGTVSYLPDLVGEVKRSDTVQATKEEIVRLSQTSPQQQSWRTRVGMFKGALQESRLAEASTCISADDLRLMPGSTR